MTPTTPIPEAEVERLRKFPYRVSASDFYKLRPAIAAHEAEWISGGKLKECVQAWINGADFTDPKQRTWEGHHPEQTAKEELCELLREAMSLLGGMPLSDFQSLRARISKRLEQERMI